MKSDEVAATADIGGEWLLYYNGFSYLNLPETDNWSRYLGESAPNLGLGPATEFLLPDLPGMVESKPPGANSSCEEIRRWVTPRSGSLDATVLKRVATVHFMRNIMYIYYNTTINCHITMDHNYAYLACFVLGINAFGT